MQLDILNPEKEAVSVPVGYLAEANGSVATVMKVSAFRTMTIEQFKEEIVPTLKGGSAEGPFSYYVLRDLSRGRYITLQPDGVTEMKIEELADYHSSKLLERIQDLASRSTERKLERYVLNSPLPVLHFAKGAGCWEIAVKIPETKFKYASKYTEDLTIYMPPSVYVLRCSDKNTYIQSSLYILKRDSIDPDKIVLARPCLPNIAEDCRICVGLSRFTEGLGENPKPIQVVAAAWELFLGSVWNKDYSWSSRFPSNLYEVAERTELDYTGILIDGPKVMTSNMRGSSGYEHRLRTALALLKIPGKWEELDWPETELRGCYAAADF